MFICEYLVDNHIVPGPAQSHVIWSKQIIISCILVNVSQTFFRVTDCFQMRWPRDVYRLLENQRKLYLEILPFFQFLVWLSQELKKFSILCLLFFRSKPLTFSIQEKYSLYITIWVQWTLFNTYFIKSLHELLTQIRVKGYSIKLLYKKSKGLMENNFTGTVSI